MNVATFEGIVEQGLIRLKNGASLPDKVRVYIVVPDLEGTNQAASRTPALAHPEQAGDFKMEMVEEQSGVGRRYQYLEQRPDKKSQELFVRGTGVRATTVWHDRFISRFSPDQIAHDRDLPLEAVYEALAYCQENWESICKEKDAERQWLEKEGFFREPGSIHQ